MRELVLNKQNILDVLQLHNQPRKQDKKLWGQDENGIKFEKEGEG